MNAKYVESNILPRVDYLSDYVHRTVSSDALKGGACGFETLWVRKLAGCHAVFPVKTEVQSLQESLHVTQQDACLCVISHVIISVKYKATSVKLRLPDEYFPN